MAEENLPTSSPTMLPETTALKSSPQDKVRKVIALTKLRSHFYQPGQTEAQIKGVIDDMLADLDHLSAYQVEDACTLYRRNSGNKFFPTPGQLIAKPAEKPVVARSNLKRFDPKEFDAPRAANLKPVAQILREHGFEKSSDRWEARSVKS